MPPTTRSRRRSEDVAAQRQPHPFSDVTSLTLLGTGTLLFLALNSYTPGDLPSWVSFSSQAVRNSPVQNIIGPFGAIVAGYLVFLLGAAAFLLPVSLIWLGLARLLMGMKLMPRAAGGAALLIFSASVFLGIQSTLFSTWWRDYNILGPGGGLGFLGNQVAQRSIGSVGAIIVALLGYGMGLLLLMGLHLHRILDAAHVAWSQIKALFDGRKAQARVEDQAEEAARLLLEHRKAERERRRLEKELIAAKKAEAAAARDAGPALSGAEALEFLDPEPAGDVAAFAQDGDTITDSGVPEPRIIDSSARRATPEERKISLAEWRRQQQKPATQGETGSGLLKGNFANYELPPLDLLHWEEDTNHQPADVSYLRATQNIIIHTLGTFNIQVTAGDITRGPTITRYEIYPSEGLRVNRIAAVEADLARATRAERINILAPIPGKDTVGIEIANKDKVAVPLRELIEDPVFAQGKARLPLALGKDVYGETIVADLASMPHLLVAGATGSGKSVCINSIIGSLLFQFTPEQLRFIMIDPKVVEMQIYNDLPHLVVPVVTDAKKVIMALRWVVNEMENRYQMFASEGVRNFDTFNARKAKAEAKAKADAEANPGDAAAKQRSAKGRRKTIQDELTLPLFAEDEAAPEMVIPAEPETGGDAGFSLLTDDADGTEVDREDGETADISAEDDRSVSAGEDEEYAEGEDEETADRRPLMMHRVSLDSAPDNDIWDDSELVAEDNDEDDGVLSIPDQIPYIVVIIDELADLMQTAPADMEGLIARIAQKARAAGIHMILATQTPRAEVITGVIKANIPCRIAFQVSSALDSRVILDTKGADKLVGKGDMLYLPPGTAKLVRVQGAFVTDDEIAALVQHCKEQGGGPNFERSVDEAINGRAQQVEAISDEDEDTLEDCIDVVMQERKASTSLLQRRLRLGYGRAARMMDLMEQRGIIGPGDGSKPREILIDLDSSDD